jgi:hypothetical protein
MFSSLIIEISDEAEYKFSAYESKTLDDYGLPIVKTKRVIAEDDLNEFMIALSIRARFLSKLKT